ncbi:MAG: M20/M25/M40 family metallo-hydrolase [Clostridia bacterium]|nr:M20/M25/M40 family metallo-hydrolase [Clostridia bacterium]
MRKEMLKDILQAFGPAGNEEIVSGVIAEYIRPYCDSVYNDAMGNLICCKKGTSGKKIMLSAHMDQIGFIVVDIDEKGFLRIANVGGILPALSVGREVAFANGVHGVIYFETPKTRDASAQAALPNMYVDIGCSTKEQAEEKVQVGDMCVYVTNMVDMGNRIASGAMDNRVCCAVIVEAMMALQSPHDVYAVFTVQEEVGLRGAAAAAYAIDPDFNINLDVTLTGDTPKMPAMSVALGDGPAIKMMDSSVIVPMSVRKFMIECAEQAKIPYQREVLRAGGTDTAVIQKVKDGILAGCISIPCRYVHTPTEVVDMADVDGAVALICEMVAKEQLPGA